MKKSACIVSLSVLVAALASVPARADDKENASAKTPPTTLTGCLSGPYDDGAFKLETSPSEKVMIGASVDVLRENAGKQVRVTGDWIATDEGKSEAAAREGDSPSERAFKAEKIEAIAADCSSGR